MKRVRHSGLAVIETKWWKNSNISISPFIETACSMFDEGPIPFHYEMATSAAAFREAIPRMVRTLGTKYLYIAAHGTEAGLECFNGDVLTSKEITELLAGALSQRGVSLKGVHFGVCHFGGRLALSSMLQANPKLTWASGYDRSVDWLGSAATDMQFLFHLLGSREPTDQLRIADAAEALRTLTGGACAEYGLAIYSKAGGKSPVKNLLERE